jgi:soluble lytic murein transglycosylase
MLSRYRDTIRVWTDPIGRALFRLHLRPNHLTLFGFVVSLGSAGAFVAGRTVLAGLALFVAGLFDFFDGSLARASGQVTPFGAFLDSVIDRYSDIVVLLGIVVLFARTPHARGAIVAMAGLVGSVMVSYTKARAESIGIACNVGFMERPERMICLIAGAVLDLLEPALWVLAVLSNVTALQRIAFTRRAIRDAAVPLAVVAALLLTVAPAAAQRGGTTDSGARTVVAIPPERVAAWAQAVAAFQHGDPRPVIAEFGAAAALDSVIGDYARVVLADALARRGDVAAARAQAIAVADRHADSRLAPGALALAATLAAGAGDDAGAQALLARLLDSYPDSSEAPAALYRLAMTAEARGQRESAALAYRELRVIAPTSGWADGAADRLEALGAMGVHVPELSLTQRLDRAERLLRGGVPTTAAEEAERVAKETRDPGLGARALRVVADASQRLGRYGVAARALELAAAQAPADRRPGLQLEQGRVLLRAGQKERALALFTEVQTKGAEPEAAEASYQRARALDELDRLPQAESAYRAVAGRYPNREVAGTALWRLGWLAHGKNDLRAAEQHWIRVGEIPGGRGHRVAALYWAGRMREKLQNVAAAERFYRKVLTEAPRSYYGVLAARRVASPPERPAEPTLRLPSDPRAAVGDDPGFARAELLRRIGLVEFGWLELEHVAQRAVGDPVRLYGVSGAYVRDERYHMALRILRRHFGALAASGHPTVPRAFWEMLYPFGWRDEVRTAAERAGLDPFLVAAVVREESSYYPRAVSRAGARGLMQLMPATAQPMAEVRGLPFRGGDLLDEPGANIQLGTSFLGGLLKEFNDPRLALAAYNAGPRRAREWWSKRRSDDVEAWVEMIPFDETRQYVKRVMLSWEEYQRIYGGR